MRTNTNPGDSNPIDAAERRKQVVAYRRRRMTFAEIGEAMGFSAQRAHKLYTEALAEVPASEVNEHRTEELTLIDDAVADLLLIAQDHRQPRTAVEAWNSIRGWADRKAKLLGLDAPVKVQAEAEGLGAEIAALISELGGGGDTRS